MSGSVSTNALFIGLTRPPLIFGVSYTYALFNLMICMLTYIITVDFSYIVLMFPIHAIGYYICMKEPLFIELFKIRAQKCSQCKNRFYHKCNSYDPY